MQNDTKPIRVEPFSVVDPAGNLQTFGSLPAYQKADQEMKDQLKKKQLTKIENIKHKNFEDYMNIKIISQAVLWALALIVAGIFTFAYPGSGVEGVVVPVVAAIAGALGMSNWREKYGQAKDFFKSKTRTGALLVAVPVIALIILPLLMTVPAWLLTLLGAVAAIGGGSTLIGVIDVLKKPTGAVKMYLFFFIAGAAALILDSIYNLGTYVSFAAITAISGTTKSGSQKTARQRSFGVKEAIADTLVSAPTDALKSVEFELEGVNDEGAFGTNTIGQKGTGKLILYGAAAAIRTFAHELVTKNIEHCAMTTNSGVSYTFATTDATPAICFAYGKVPMVTSDDKPIVMELLMSTFRDNLAMS